MGCDIHDYVEIMKDGKWQHYDWRAEFQDGTYDDGSPKHNWEKILDHPLYIGRNYNLFAVLANVRNGRGFAGVPTGVGFKPICGPRGLPDNVSQDIAQESDSWGVDGHSHSWLKLDELLDYDWNGQSTQQFGVVSIDEYRQYKENGKPFSWSDDVWGSKIKKISNLEMDKFLENGFPNDDLHYYTHIIWEESYRDAVGKYWFNVMEYLKTLGEPDEVRLVFWFDN